MNVSTGDTHARRHIGAATEEDAHLVVRACCRKGGGSCACARGWMKPGHALAHRSGHRHNNSKGGHGRGVQRAGARGGQGPAGGEGTVWQRGARGVCLRVPTVRPRSTRRGRGAPQQATCTSGFARVKGQWRGQAVGLVLLAPLDRREEVPTRKVASDPEAPVPARAATGRRRRAREAPPERPQVSGSRAPLHLEATCARRSGLTRGGGDLPTHHRAMPRRRSSPPPPPPASARARAGGPRRLKSLPVTPTAQVSRLCGLRGAVRPPPCRGCLGQLRGGPGCPSGAPNPSWGTL